jgi:hypothetical protein
VKKYCPHCGAVYEWYVAECPTCRVALVDQEIDQQGDVEAQGDAGDESADEEPRHDANFVVVYSGPDGLFAQMALEQADIEYVTRGHGDSYELGVRTEDEARAHELLDDLSAVQAAEDTVPSPSPQTPVSVPPSAGGPSQGDVQLVDAESGALIGQISEAQFKLLEESLEEESPEGWQYYIDEPTLALLQDQRVDAGVIDMLRRALGTREAIEVRLVRKEPSDLPPPV